MAGPDHRPPETHPDGITLFLCGDVMTGRGIDQILPSPSPPHLFEPYVRSALDYVAAAEKRTGPIARPVHPSYIWGDALGELERVRPHARVVNLETAVTTSEAAWPGKGIHYRMHPANAPCLTAAGIDCCVLANNHVMDWGRDGLLETLDTLRQAGLQTAGAGRDVAEATAPAIVRLPGAGRLLVFAAGCASAGVPDEWAAGTGRPGVHVLEELSEQTARRWAAHMLAARRPGDVVVASIHWGGNWGYAVPSEHRIFAHCLVDLGAADIVHGHSSHHPMAIDVHRDRPILYGCGDFLNDYEGISGYESYRSDLTLMYCPTLSASRGTLREFELVPMQISRFRLNRPDEDAVRWLEDRLNREERPFGVGVVRGAGGTLRLRVRAGARA